MGVPVRTDEKKAADERSRTGEGLRLSFGRILGCKHVLVQVQVLWWESFCKRPAKCLAEIHLINSSPQKNYQKTHQCQRLSGWCYGQSSTISLALRIGYYYTRLYLILQSTDLRRPRIDRAVQ